MSLWIVVELPETFPRRRIFEAHAGLWYFSLALLHMEFFYDMLYITCVAGEPISPRRV